MHLHTHSHTHTHTHTHTQERKTATLGDLPKWLKMGTTISNGNVHFFLIFTDWTGHSHAKYSSVSRYHF